MPTAARVSMSRGQVLGLISQYWPESEWEAALAVSYCESSWRPWATGRAGEIGLFQLHPAYHAWRWAGEDPYEPAVNVRVAYDVWRDNGPGWRPWTCRP